MNFENWNPCTSKVFFSRKDKSDIRWGDWSIEDKPMSPHKNSSIGVWGYEDDQGIIKNGGRPGAQYAPQWIRNFFYRQTPPIKSDVITSNEISSLQASVESGDVKPKITPLSSSSKISAQNLFQISDYGNWQSSLTPEEMLKKIPPILASHLQNHPMITLGGGHDYAAVDGAGFLEWQTQKYQAENSQDLWVKPLIINFDAHYDVRPWQNGINSGTPFSWLMEHYPQKFEFIEIGIQNQCASPHHGQWIKDKGGQIIDSNFISKVGILSALRQCLAGTNPQQDCYISFDIDVLNQAQAPGCSQSWMAGIDYHQAIEALLWIFQNKKVRLLGIYEVSPPLDLDHRTSKVAACLMDHFIRYIYQSKFCARA